MQPQSILSQFWSLRQCQTSLSILCKKNSSEVALAAADIAILQHLENVFFPFIKNALAITFGNFALPKAFTLLWTIPSPFQHFSVLCGVDLQ